MIAWVPTTPNAEKLRDEPQERDVWAAMQVTMGNWYTCGELLGVLSNVQELFSDLAVVTSDSFMSQGLKIYVIEA